ncbi:MAG: GNAT family N-acetyltransferase [Ferruginibacter sp.]
MPEIITADTEAAYREAAILFREYAAWLNIDLCFQQFDKELEELHVMYARPAGIILLAKENNLFVGCVAVRKKENDVAELKRMYIKPDSRKSGLGVLLLEKALAFAKETGYRTIRLDTLSHMTPAISLYRKAGFYEIAPYYFNPEKNAVFFEKML